MTNDWLPINKIVEGDAVETLAKLPDSSIHMAMCSPPYYGLRDYGADGQIGLEDSLDEYIDRLVDVGGELRRVLRDDGSWWLNLGDSYCTRRRARKSGSEQDIAKAESERTNEDYSPSSDGEGRYHNASLMDHSAGFVDKDKMLVPHRTAIALQEAGWVVRNDNVWRKTNPMPESANDRFSTTFEFLFFLTPNPNYWSDFDSVREPHTSRVEYRNPGETYDRNDENQSKHPDSNHSLGINDQHPLGKNPGDVFELPTASYSDAHFSVYPERLCEKPIKATCPEKVCVECGVPYRRETETERVPDHVERGQQTITQLTGERSGKTLKRPDEVAGYEEKYNVLHYLQDWEKQCDCDTSATEPGVVLDPFAGAGTTCLVAKQLGRRFVGIDLNPEYVAIAQARVGISVDNPEYLINDGQSTLGSVATTD